MAKGFYCKVSSFNAYDVNGYRFHTTDYEKNQANARTTNTGVFTPGVVTPDADQEDYYGTVEEIYELEYMVKKHLSLPYSNASGLNLQYRESPLNLG